MNKKYLGIALLSVIIVIGAGIVIANRPHYKVMAGELSVGTEFTISPCKVVAVNLRDGKTITIPLTIKNNTDNEMVFSITERIPDRLTEGYKSFVNNGVGLFITTDSLDFDNLIVAANSDKKINLYLLLEEGGILDGNYEAWVSVETAVKIPNYINTELCQRILIEGR